MDIILLSGLAGAGKSCAVKTFEDLGYYCVDNLPLPLVDQCIDTVRNDYENIEQMALVLDARNYEHFHRLPEKIQQLKSQGEKISLVFLDASDEVLARRFQTTRHRHPLVKEGSLLAGIHQERKILKDIRNLADEVYDTSQWNVHQLRKTLLSKYSPQDAKQRLSISVMSFGYRNGLPLNANLVFDVRFVENPYFHEHLRQKSGKDSEVSKFVLEQQEAQNFAQKMEDMLVYLLPLYEREGKSYLNVAIGCTGGQHRSVAMAIDLVKRLEKFEYSPSISHRDVESLELS